jgi:hypothetical protein
MRPRVCGLWDLRGGDADGERLRRDDSHSQVYTQNSQLSGTRKPAKPVEIVLRLDLSLDLT